MSGRFSHIRFDDESKRKSELIRQAYVNLEKVLMSELQDSRRRALAITEAESSEAWANKALRDDQLARERKAMRDQQASPPAAPQEASA